MGESQSAELERVRAELDELRRSNQELTERLAVRARAGRARGSRWRSVVVVTLLVLGLLLAPLAVLTVWLRNTVLDTDHYVTTMAPLAASPAVQDAVTNAATSAIFAQVDVAQLAREGLPPRAQFLAEPEDDFPDRDKWPKLTRYG
jgi:hypothetical protein